MYVNSILADYFNRLNYEFDNWKPIILDNDEIDF